MSVNKAIPTIWSARIIESLDSSTVTYELVNRDWEGEITDQGNEVKILGLQNVTVKDHTRNQPIDAPEQLNLTDVTLKIDQAKYFNIALDDVDKVQAKPELLDKFAAKASHALAKETDKYIIKTLQEGALKTGLGTTDSPLTINKDNAYAVLVAMKTLLDKANVPQQNRWVLLPPEFEGLMLLDPRFAYNTGASETRLINGHIAKGAGFKIYISNDLTTADGKSYIFASYPGACTFANQLVKMETYRSQSLFADGLRGLYLFGATVVQSDAVAVGVVQFDNTSTISVAENEERKAKTRG